MKIQSTKNDFFCTNCSSPLQLKRVLTDEEQSKLRMAFENYSNISKILKRQIALDSEIKKLNILIENLLKTEVNNFKR